MSVDYSTLDDTALAQQLHKLALQLHTAIGAKDVAAVKALWAEFQTAAQEYDARDNLSGLDALLNQVSDGVTAFLQSAVDAAGTVGSSVLRSLFWPVALAVIVLAIAYLVYRKARA